MATANSTSMVVAVIGQVLEEKRYVVVYPHTGFRSSVPEGESITFSLSRWGGTSPPQKGDIVWLHRVVKTVNGWRAGSAQPSQQNTQTARKDCES